MAQGKRPDVDGFAALVDWLRVPADDFLVGTRSATQRDQQGTMAMISTHLRASKELSPESAAALEDIVLAAYQRLKESS